MLRSQGNTDLKGHPVTPPRNALQEPRNVPGLTESPLSPSGPCCFQGIREAYGGPHFRYFRGLFTRSRVRKTKKKSSSTRPSRCRTATAIWTPYPTRTLIKIPQLVRLLTSVSKSFSPHSLHDPNPRKRKQRSSPPSSGDFDSEV